MRIKKINSIVFINVAANVSIAASARDNADRYYEQRAMIKKKISESELPDFTASHHELSLSARDWDARCFRAVPVTFR